MHQSVIAGDAAGQSADQRQILQEGNASDHALGLCLKLPTDGAEADQLSALQANSFQVQALSRLDVIKDFQVRAAAYDWLATRSSGGEKVSVFLQIIGQVALAQPGQRH